MEGEIATVEVGKRADLTVLEAGPHEVAPEKIRDIGVWGTVLSGWVNPLATK